MLPRRGSHRNCPAAATWRGCRRWRLPHAGLGHDSRRVDFGFRTHVLQVLFADSAASAEGLGVEESQHHVLQSGTKAVPTIDVKLISQSRLDRNYIDSLTASSWCRRIMPRASWCTLYGKDISQACSKRVSRG